MNQSVNRRSQPLSTAELSDQSQHLYASTEILVTVRLFPHPASAILRFMARQPPKPPTARVSDWGATGCLGATRRFLTSAQNAEVRRKRADLDAKLRQMMVAERDRRR